MHTFLLQLVKSDIFADFFLKQEQKQAEAVDALFTEIFQDAFIEESELGREKFCYVIDEKLSDDV